MTLPISNEENETQNTSVLKTPVDAFARSIQYNMKSYLSQRHGWD